MKYTLEIYEENTIVTYSIENQSLVSGMSDVSPELTSQTNGGIIPDSDYNAFKLFFTGLVDKSVKSFIRGLVSWVNSLALRVGLLEDKYILKYVVPVDSISVNLTQDKYGNPFNFVEGDKIDIITIINSNVNAAYVLGIQLNGIDVSGEYLYSGTTSYLGLLAYIHSFAHNKSEMQITSDGMIMTTDTGWINAEKTSWGRYNVSSFTKPVSLGGIVSAPIARITFIPYGGLIKAGSTIIIKRA